MNRIKSETAANGVKEKFIECVQFGNAGAAREATGSY